MKSVTDQLREINELREDYRRRMMESYNSIIDDLDICERKMIDDPSNEELKYEHEAILWQKKMVEDVMKTLREQ